MKFKWMRHLIRFTIAAGITALLAPFSLDVIEYATYDLRMRYSPKPPVSGDVVLLAISPKTVEGLQREPEALDWALTLKQLLEARPLQVVSLINPTTLSGSFDDLSVMAGVATQLPLVFGENDLPKPGLDHFDPLPAPFEAVEISPAPRTADRTVLARDGVTRRAILSFDGHPTILPTLVANQRHRPVHLDYSGVFDFLGSQQVLIRYREPGAFKRYEFVDVMEGRVNPRDLREKIVLIGRDSQASASDYVTTPINKDLVALSMVEMHANAIETLIADDAPILSPRWFTLLLTFLMSILTIYVVLSWKPARGLILLATVGVSLVVFGWAALIAVDWVVPLAHPLIAMFIGYYFVIPYRLIIENRRSWEYYQKNKLLTQVEELKSNFMRMMSHDLKTPLARIQGMADILAQDQSQLSARQRDALSRLVESGHELTDFIGSILSLSRIESKDMKLDLHSHDVNKILTSALRKLDHLAVKKNIEVCLELEPLFSVRVDSSLLQTVFVNILENALKYSPEGSRVLVSSEEVGHEVVVQIADQGPGIGPAEKHRIFERFYRGEDSRKSSAGNGLGLYLARYFIELHNGKVEMESELGSGSTFTIRLPVDMNPPAHPADTRGEMYA